MLVVSRVGLVPKVALQETEGEREKREKRERRIGKRLRNADS